MNIEKLFSTLEGSYHDGALCDAKYKHPNLYMHCFRNPPDPEQKEAPDYKYVVIRFDNVTDLQIYDWEKRFFVPYKDGDFDKEDDAGAICGINYLDYEDDYIVFGECLRFHAEDVTLLANASEELDFSKYC